MIGDLVAVARATRVLATTERRARAVGLDRARRRPGQDVIEARGRAVGFDAACRLARITDAPPQPINRPELDAECELLWFTVAAGSKEAR